MPATKRQSTIKMPSVKKRSAVLDDCKVVKKRRLELEEPSTVDVMPAIEITETTEMQRSDSLDSASSSVSRVDRSVYAQARSILRLSSSASSNTPLLGRERQRKTINNFLANRFTEHFTAIRDEEEEEDLVDEENGGEGSIGSQTSTEESNDQCGALYICGRPGTGKTMLVAEIVQSKPLKSMTINCTTVLKPASILIDVLEKMTGSTNSEQNAKSELEAAALSEDTEPFLLVLDEVDHLKDRNVLLHLFQLASSPSSRLTVIGIANALDLSSNLFANLSSSQLSQCNFPPYSANDMAVIGTARLRSLLSTEEESATPCIAEAALQLAAKKIAANSGDLRTFLSVIRKAIEITEARSTSTTAESFATAAKAGPREVLAAMQFFQVSSSTAAPTNGSPHAHLQAISVNQVSGISAKLQSLGLAARVALTGVCVCLDRYLTISPKSSRSPSPSPTKRPKLAPRTPSKSAVAKSDELDFETAWTTYTDILRNAKLSELGQQRSDWESLLDTLTSCGLLADEKTRIASPKAKKGSTSPKRGGRSLRLMYPLKSVLEALRTHVTDGKAEGTHLLCQILDEEARNKGRRLRVWESQTDAPSRGFNGDGLDGQEDTMIGKHQGGRNVDDDL